MTEENSSRLPIWTGESPDPMKWGNYRYAIQGYCSIKGLGALFLPGYKRPVRADEDFQEKNAKLMGILLQTTKDVAGLVVRPFADGGDGIGAWKALISRYGNDSKELRRARQIEFQRMLEATECVDREGILDMLHTADHLFRELQKLECPLPESYKINFLMLRIRDIAPEMYTTVSAKTDISYEKCVAELKNLSAYNTAVDRAKMESIGRCSTVVGEKLNRKEHRAWRPEKNQCYWCLKKGHNALQCRKRLAGGDSSRRPDGTYYQGKLTKGTAKGKSDTPKSFMATSFQVEANIEGTFMSNSANSGTNQECKEGNKMWLIDSGCNKHMSPHIEDFDNLKNANIICRFGNKGEITAKGVGDVIIYAREESGKSCKIQLKNVLYVPGLSNRLISTGQLRRAGGKFIDSTEMEAKLELPDKEGALTLIEKGDLLWLEQIKIVEYMESNATYAPGKRESASGRLIDWHETLGHCHPAGILTLEQRGLIKVTGPKDINQLQC